MPPGLGPVPAVDHAAPAPAAGPRTVEEDPAAARIGALSQSAGWRSDEQVSRGLYYRPDEPTRIAPLPQEPVAPPNQMTLARDACPCEAEPRQCHF